MFKFYLFILFISVAQAFCKIKHKDVWSCIVKDSCVNKYKLHAMIRDKKATSLRRQFLMAVEGSKYHRLFEDCDFNNDGCISMQDILSSNIQCQRSCIWRETMHDLLC